MDSYKIIIAVLTKIYAGKNLKDELNLLPLNNDTAKIKNHVYGIIRNYYALNFILKQLLTKPVKEYKIELILQMGLFELLYSKKPVYAVVNDIVNLTKTISPNFVSLVNALLRNCLRQKDIFIQKIEQDYSLKYNLPEWFINKLKIQYGGTLAKEILVGFNFHPAFGIRINPHKIDNLAYEKLLNENKLDFEKIGTKIVLAEACQVKQLPLFFEGAVSIQDIAAQYSLDLLQKYKIKPQIVLDACAAPGGKTCQILENYNCDLIAIDNSESRLNKIKENIKRLELNATILLADAAQQDWWNKQAFDLIIADVPCSATGTIKRNPDIKINRKITDINKFVLLQRSIIKNLFSLLEVNGYLLYITCSIFKDENQENIKWFTENIPGFTFVDDLQIFPNKYNDSLYYALIRKV